MLLPPGAGYVEAQWGVWRAGGVFVPLCLSATPKEISYALADADIACVITTKDSAGNLPDHGILRVIDLDEALTTDPAGVQFPELTPDRRAMMLYTSGTTSKPKGLVSTHGCIAAQIESLVEAWQWSADDRIPLFLPLHHVHGIINVLGCALWSGALVETFPRLDTAEIFPRVAGDAYTVFMAVPTIYVKMIEALEKADDASRQKAVDGFARLRLMVSGSAALPAGIHRRWEEITGQKLLERYGMTEIGMALSNPYDGERRAGAVGLPLSGVFVRLKNDEGKIVSGEDEPGEVQVRGPSVFLEYWNRPEITAGSFDEGWFRTGDIAVLGVEDPTWGEAVGAAIVLREGAGLDEKQLRVWCKDRMSPYKVPRLIKIVPTLPRNAMGKVTKPDVKKLFV